jgi:hypothetical protein
MPKRPKQRQLESESQVAFTSALPKGWLYRTMTPDYGIDGLVEVFSEDTKATGGMFFVQLKATDQPNISKALRIPLRYDMLTYYQTILLPVLIVRYHAPTQSLFAQFVRKSTPPKKTLRATRVFRLTEEDRWSEQIVATALQSLRDIRDIGLRELLIRDYYEAKRRVVWSAPAGEDLPVVHSMLNPGASVTHYVLGDGIVESASDSYAFVAFKFDGLTRKFLPGDFHEFHCVEHDS